VNAGPVLVLSGITPKVLTTDCTGCLTQPFTACRTYPDGTEGFHFARFAAAALAGVLSRREVIGVTLSVRAFTPAMLILIRDGEIQPSMCPEMSGTEPADQCTYRPGHCPARHLAWTGERWDS
jgi:hypothetical protein